MIIAPGKTLLLVTGIFYIVIGGMAILSSAVNIAIANYWNTTMPLPTGMSWSVYYAVTLLGALFTLFVGIMGAANNKRLEKASTLKVLGIIAICYVVLSSIFASFMLFILTSFLSDIFGHFSNFLYAFIGIVAIFSLGIGLILPILYTIGAQRNLKAYRAMQAHHFQ